MVSGYLPDEHGIFHDDLRPGYLNTPTVMSLAKQAGKRVVMVVGKDKLVQLDLPGSTDVYVVAGGDQEVVNQAMLQASVGFDLMFIHLPLVDLTGHASGWMSPAYLSQVAAADAALGRLLQAVGPQVTVIVSADHGGYDFVHWSGAPEDWQIPWIIAGPGIRAGHDVASTVSTVDTAATAAAVLGLTLDPEASGQPVDEAFDR
jgi:phosphopentomutase